MSIGIIFLLGLLGIVLLWVIAIYNGLIRRRNEVDNAFGGMDVQLKKRYDLIPNLVETVKQYAEHEKELLSEITKLRARAVSGEMSTDEKVALDNTISSKIGGIMVAVENYPDLKASQNFMDLQRTLNEVESQISASRRTYNAVVTAYNNGIQTFPQNLVASQMNMQAKEVFVISEAERENVNVKDLFKD